MGCFSCVCIVSKLPIYGHPVVGIPISKSKPIGHKRIACYPNTDWRIDGFPFFGDNDDYGRVEDYEDGPYHELNIKKYGEALSDEELMSNWCQPLTDKSIMFVHRPVWDKLIKLHRKEAERVYKKFLKHENRFSTLLKKVPIEDLKKIGTENIKSVPEFCYESCGFSKQLLVWCNENYSLKVKEALIDLMAFDISCIFTHTIYQTTYTIGEQISGWANEAKNLYHLASFAQNMLKERMSS